MQTSVRGGRHRRYVQQKTRNSCDHPFLPVMVTGTKISPISNQVKYILCTQYGHLRGTFHRESIRFKEHMTLDIVKINVMEEDIDARKLTVEEASAQR
jgi:hypothetical protein